MHHEFFELLRKDHELFRSLLQKLRSATNERVKEREELFAQFRLSIIPHTRAEDNVFYSRLMEHQQAYADALESVEERHVIELAMNELAQKPKQTDQWLAKLRVCKELVEHHIEEEEEKIFDHARKALSAGEMRSIYDRFQAERERIKNSIA